MVEGIVVRFRAGDKDPVVFEEPSLKAIAEAKGKSVAQVSTEYDCSKIFLTA